MKVLFISKANLPDFQNDMVFHGAKTILGEDVVDVNKMWYMYSDDKEKYWNTRVPNNGKSYGRGFTLYGHFQPDNTDRENIDYKIREKYFDKIIYGSIHRCKDYFELVSKNYSENDIIFIDGEDHVDIVRNLIGRGQYFKRELIHNITENLKPINFAIPSKWVLEEPPSKIKHTATIIPGNLQTYIYDNELDYFNGYKESYFGITHKKGGWDCLRHYEILMNGCIPLFSNLENCPVNTMSNFPKQIVIECNSVASKLSHDDLIGYISILLEYTKRELTTEKLFNYIMNA
jgi:hypothetical protein